MKLTALSARVDDLLGSTSQRSSAMLQSTLYHGVLGVMQSLYGTDSIQEKALRDHIEAIRQKGHPANEHDIAVAIDVVKGTLTSIKAELDAGFIGSLRVTLTGEVLADLIKLSRTTLTETGDGSKNVAAVLAAAAFEGAMRKLSDTKGLGEQEKLADVLTTLKDNGVLQGAEVGIAQSYLSFRNRALHAKWSEVDRPGIESALAFTEQLILKHFT